MMVLVVISTCSKLVYHLIFFIFVPLMGRIHIPVLTPEERTALESGFKTGSSHCFRNRCHVILLKSEGRSSKDVGKIAAMSHVSVNSWLVRFKQEGIKGLKNKSGQGRKLIISKEDEAPLLAAVKANRQRLLIAKAEWEAQSGKAVSRSTLRRFLKSLAEDINE
jgi:transposase